MLIALGFVGAHLGWFLAAGAVVAAVGGVATIVPAARERRIPSRLFAAAVAIGVGSLVLSGLPLLLGIFARPVA